MSENFNSHIACEGTDNDINWVCKVCKDLPNYAGMYLYQREREKNQLKNVKDRRADLILLKYYYALLHLLDKIHELHECPNPENDVPKYADRKCSTPECFVYYRYIYNTYASILMTEKGLNQINLRCDICSVLPYTIFSDLEMIAKNMHSDDMEKTQKLEIEAVIADYYLEAVGSCEQWDECPSGVDWLELIKSVQLLRKYLEKKDRKYNATKACQAIYRSFCKLGGRPAVLVIDQDAVFVASETYGEVIKTRIFGDFCTEQDLKLWVCNKADPESKGPIENSVGFVKKNFFSARTITCIDDVWRSLPGWLERKNKRIHRATLRIPMAVFRDIEKDSLRSVLPSVYETSPNSFIAYECKGTPYVLFRSCRYSVPRSYAYSVVKYKITAGKIHIYDEDLRFLCTHLLSERRGSFNQLPEHRKGDSGDWIEIMERLCDKWNCYDFQHFINGVKKENPRHISKQLGAIEQFLDSENPDRALVADVMKRCCDNYRYQFSQFKVVYEYVKAGRSLADSDGARVVVSSDRVEYKDLSVYGKAFQERVNRSGQEAAV